MAEVIKIIGIFALMVAVLKMTRQLAIAIGSAAILAAFLFNLGFLNALVIAGKSVISPMTYTTLLAFYSITFLQRLLEKRSRLIKAQESLNGIFNNRRINASLAPILIGMLPAAGVVTIAGSIVNAAAGESLDLEEKNIVSTY
jgi:hypothetical protein